MSDTNLQSNLEESGRPDSGRLGARTKKLVFFAVLAAVSFLGLFYFAGKIPFLTRGSASEHSLGLYLLINFNIIVVMVLCFLVARNLVKLILDRRRNILGSRLRTRLVVAFVGLSLIPMALLFATAKGIVDSALRGWFSPQVQSTVDGALNVAKYHYRDSELRLRGQLDILSFDLSKLLSLSFGEVDETNKEILEEFLRAKRVAFDLEELALYGLDGEVLVQAIKDEIPPPNLAALARAASGISTTQPEQSLRNEFLRSYKPISGKGLGVEGQLVLVGTHKISPELVRILAGVLDSHDDYQELHSYRRPLASSYLLTLIGAMLLLVFAAIWVGFYLAKSLSVPIQKLAEATEEVALGNLEHRIPEVGDDELGVLVHSFNTMTGDLKRTTGELDSRRRYIEAILASLGVGVISIDKMAAITTRNDAAAGILGLEEKQLAVGKHLFECLKAEQASQIEEQVEALYRSEEQVITGNVHFEESHLKTAGEKHLHLTLTKLLSESGGLLGAVILFDDLSELVRAQRMAAWRDVARRIAHEIKNPLTPIQLSAQRLQRRVVKEGNLDPEQERIAVECTTAIVKQVETLRVLVNEFSQFAKMPKASLKPADLNELVREVISVYRDGSSQARFEIRLEKGLPQAKLDKDQIKRVVVNLVDNALTSIAGKPEQVEGEIVVETSSDQELGLLSLTVSDNGVGIPDTERARVFEPYYTNRSGGEDSNGTGLGLAIVSSVIADHNGFIRIKDNFPAGVKFVIELPLSPADASGEHIH